MKYILVAGGVISGIGKGVIASSLGLLMKACGLRVTSIKIDPYINIDAGTFSPYEHGETFVLDDGGEVDLDLGNYERFLDVTLTKDNNITTGKIYQSVIARERSGDYLGKTVQVVPHITDEIQEWVERVAEISVDGSHLKPEVCIIELGGTVGDIESMPFIEAFRQFQFRVGRENFCCALVSLIPRPSTTGEQKTKPTQNTVRELRGLGLSPDLLMCRCTEPLTESVIAKLSMFGQVHKNQVVCVQDVSSLYRVPLLLEQQKVHHLVYKQFQLEPRVTNPRRHLLYQWKELADRADRSNKEVRIALVGKYVQLQDAYASVVKALQHAALLCNLKLVLEYVSSEDMEASKSKEDPVCYHRAWEKLCSAKGVIVPGGFGIRGVEGKMAAIRWCREKKRPFLGICLGMQCAVVEFARNALGLEGASSNEFNPETTNPVVIEMPEFNPGQMGGTMRLGRRKTLFQMPTPGGPPQKSESVIRMLYGNHESVDERHRHRYEVNPKYIEDMEKAGMRFVGRDAENKRMEILELEDHPYFVAVQYHPEYTSRPMKPSPPYLGLILAASNKLNSYVRNGCRLSPRSNSFLDDSDDDEALSVSACAREVMQRINSAAELNGSMEDDLEKSTD